MWAQSRGGGTTAEWAGPGRENQIRVPSRLSSATDKPCSLESVTRLRISLVPTSNRWGGRREWGHTRETRYQVPSVEQGLNRRGCWFFTENPMVCSILILSSRLLPNRLAFRARPARRPPAASVPSGGPHSSASAPCFISVRLAVHSHAMYFPWAIKI